MTVLTFLLPYWRRYRRLLLAGLLWLVLTNLLAMAIPWLLQRGIDGAAAGNWQAVAVAAGLMAAAAFARGTARVLSRLRFLHTARYVEVDLRQDLLSRLLDQGTPFFDRHRTGDLLSRFTNDLANLRMMAGFGLLTLCNAALVYLFSLVMLLRLAPGLTLVGLLPYPLLLLLVKRLSRSLLQRSSEVQEGLGLVSEAVEEAVSGQAVVRAYNLRGHLGSEFDRRNASYLERNLALSRLRALVLPVMTVIGPLSTLLAFYFGGRLVVDGALSLGELVAFNAYLVQLAWPTTLLGWVLTLLQRARASSERLLPILAAPRTEAAGGEQPLPGPPSLSARRLSFGYGERPVLQDLAFDLPAGALVGITGPTGAGKSSLLRLLAGLYPPAAGTLLVAGQDLARLDLRAHRRRLAMVPQEGRLFSGSLRQNLLYADPAGDDRRLAEIAATVALDSDLEELPAGLATAVGEGGISLSGGQRQRVALGRALARDGSLWLLDDPFSHLDAATARRVWAQLRPKLAGRTVVLVSSRVSLLAGVEQVLVLDRGRLVASGRHAELLAAGGLYARLYRREQLQDALEVAP